MSIPVWTPSKERQKNSNIWKFMEYVKHKHQIDLNNYAQLHSWSVNHRDLFWEAVWDFSNIHYHKNYTLSVENAEDMPGADWFPAAELNFAENLLRYKNDKIALIYRGENGDRSSMTYAGLNRAVAQLAAALRQSGVGVGDRVAGFLPNIPQTVIAMLAASSLGAIWSSCSPDFGLNGVLDRFRQIEPKILFCADAYYYNGKQFDCLNTVDLIKDKIQSIEKVIVVENVHEDPDIRFICDSTLFSDYLHQSVTEPEFTYLPFNHPLYIMYSSGTTGLPKCIVHSAGGTLIQHAKELMLHTDVTENDRIFFYTTCGWMMWNWLVSSLFTGATVVLYDGSPFHPSTLTLFNMIDEEKISIFGTSARFIASVEKEQLRPGKSHSLQSLKSILSTGSPLAPASYDFVYQHIKKDVCLSSISGGTDIISCFALGCPILPVYQGELQCLGLGMDVQVFNDTGEAVLQEKGELVCAKTFPSMPVGFWNDQDGSNYHKAYFNRFPQTWAHGDFAEITDHGGLIIHGRSDAVLNPGGVRIGTAEIYRQVEKVSEVLESVAVGQNWQDDVRVVLFVVLKNEVQLTEELRQRIKKLIRSNATPRHVPAKIIQVVDIPKTISGKIVELAIRKVIHDEAVENTDALKNPEALQHYKNLQELTH